MQKRQKSRLRLSARAEKIAVSFCRSENRDINEFLEEAITEKIEFEQMKNGSPAYDFFDEDDVVVEEEFFKRKH